MNYYEHHLGDYMRDTAHLSMIEDAAYRRLLDAYYIRERALPGDLAECCKLARAQSKPEREAVAYVLREFFELRDGGHYQDRAEREISRFQDKQPEAQRKRDNAAERQRRTREHRKELFEQLREAGHVPCYDTPTRELVTLLNRVTGASRHAPVTCDNTATSPQSPDTRHIHGLVTPVDDNPRARAGGADPPDGAVTAPPPTEAAQVCLLLRQAGIADVSPQHPRLLALLDAGAHPGEFAAAAGKATGKAHGFAYVLGVVEGERRRAAAMVPGLHRGAMPAAPPAGETFRERDERLARERFAEFTGCSAPPPPASNVIDLEPTMKRIAS